MPESKLLYYTGRFVRTDLDCDGRTGTPDPASLAEAMLVNNGRIVSIGSQDVV